MALPTTIASTAGAQRGNHRPFLSSSGNVYVLLRDESTTSKIQMYKATDPTSSFSTVGTNPDTGTEILAIASYQAGDILHVITHNSALSYHTFNMATDAWVITNESIVTGLVTNETIFALGLMVRSDGDVIVSYNGDTIVNMGVDRTRVYYARRESASWTIDVLIDNGGATNWYNMGLVSGASDRTHFFFQDGDLDDAYQRALTSANALETFPSAYDTSIAGSATNSPAQGASYDSSGTIKIRFPYLDSVTTDYNVAKGNSADAPTISVDADVTGTGGIASGAHRMALTANGTDLYLFYTDNSSNIFYLLNSNEGGWGSPTSFYDDAASVIRIYANVYTRSGSIVVGIVYSTSTTAKYHELTLSAGTTNAAFDMDAVAAITWGSSSTATSNLNSTAAASLTWNGTGLYPAALSAVAAASLTWNGAEVTAATEANWSSAAAASVTWGGTGLYPAALSSTASASLTWNGASTVTSNLSSIAVASLTWNGAATATSALSANAVASLTWNGTGIYPAALEAVAAASLTWNGAAVSVEAAAWNSAAVASLTVTGASTATSALSSTAAASLTWNGASTATSSLSSTAVASLTWNGASTTASALSAASLASLTWNGTAIAGGSWSSAAAASLTFNGTGIYPAALSAITVASLTWNGISTATSNLSAIAAASLTWTGLALSQSASADWSGTATASLTVEGAATTAGYINLDAEAALTWGGAVVVAQDLNGWRIKKEQQERFEEIEEEDIMFILSALATYLEQNYAY